MSFLLLICSSDYSVFAFDVGRPINFLSQVVCQNIIDRGELVINGKCLSKDFTMTDCTGKGDQEFLVCGDDRTIRQVEDNQCITRFRAYNVGVEKCDLSVSEKQTWTAEEKTENQVPLASWKIGGVSQKYYFFKHDERRCMSSGWQNRIRTTGCLETHQKTRMAFRFHNRGKTLKRAKLKYQENEKCIAADGKLFSISNEMNII